MKRISPLTSQRLLEAYETMWRIRLFEQRAASMFANAELPGFIHLSVGQEAVATGAIGALRRDDYITATHRGHGQIIAKGGALTPMFAELMGRTGGYCRGRGGSMHIFSLELGVLGANGILGASQPIGVGAALASQYRDDGRVTVTFFGEGASAQGAVHEAMNLASVWKLPVVFVVEANGWAELTPYPVHVGVDTLTRRADGYGMPAQQVDGNDLEAVHDATAVAVAHAREGSGPAMVEVLTTRWHGHYEGDPQKYRDQDELKTLEDHCPIRRLGDKLVQAGVADQARLDELQQLVRDAVEQAVKEAKQSPLPETSELMQGVYR